jgi:hypothetical protein
VVFHRILDLKRAGISISGLFLFFYIGQKNSPSGKGRGINMIDKQAITSPF